LICQQSKTTRIAVQELQKEMNNYRPLMSDSTERVGDLIFKSGATLAEVSSPFHLNFNDSCFPDEPYRQSGIQCGKGNVRGMVTNMPFSVLLPLTPPWNLGIEGAKEARRDCI
jgi:hypothetical protein